MSLIIKENGGNTNFEPIPEGSYASICYLIADMGLQPTKFGESKQIRIEWEIPEFTYETKDGETLSRRIGKTYFPSLSSKSRLRKDLEAWRGTAFTAEDLEGFNLSKLIGVPCLIQITHTKSDSGKIFEDISSFMKLPKGMPVPKPVRPQMVYDIDVNDPLDAAKLEMFVYSPTMKKMEMLGDVIKESVTWLERFDAWSEKSAPVAEEKQVELVELTDEEGVLPF